MTDPENTPASGAPHGVPGAEPGAPEAGPASGPAPGPGTEPPQRPGFTDAVADFVQMTVDYVRQETGDVVHDKVVLPTQKAGTVVAFALAAATTLVLGIMFLAASALILLAQFVGWIAALAIVGGLLIAGAGLFTYLKMRSMQR